LKKADKHKLINHYNELFSQFGYSHKTIGWGKKRHFFRYEILLSKFNIKNCSLLDFGCGFGDLSDYLIDKSLSVVYNGIDINEKLINEGIKQNPKRNILFSDPLNDGLDKNYDYIISSGVHNTKISDNLSFIKKTFDLFNSHSNKGFSMNFLSNNCDYFDENLYYSDPSEIIKIAMNYSQKVLIRHDYMPYEFTVIVYKNYTIEPIINIFSDLINNYKK
tara:strand:- start:5467 stop:6123 length:657 start_codon:yes stop_codon:yes gene_type:complete